MKSFEIRKIEPGSAFKFYFVVGVTFGLLISIILITIGVNLNRIGLELGTIETGEGPLGAGAAFIGVILASLVYGLMLGVIGAVGALVYNGFAAAVGGIVVKLNDKD
ncbi:MAG: hypothetical protein GXY86_14975 [Firmicutes bacterium]|nr:hypothetical protein [Bacillota bacterium]